MMGLFDVIKGKGAAQRPTAAVDNTTVPRQLYFHSTAAMERGLDGTEETFARFYWAIYHCSPDEPADLNDRREQLRKQYPDKVVAVGQRFILWGEAAYQALGGYYRAMASGHSSESCRKYYSQQFDRIRAVHIDSQSLPIPVDLSEGQLAHDEQLEFLACLAIMNGHIF
jgi:hypothetical protein